MRGLLYIFSRCKRDVGQTGRQEGRRSQRRVHTKNDLEWTIAVNPQPAPQPCLGYRKKILLGQQHHGTARLDGEGGGKRRSPIETSRTEGELLSALFRAGVLTLAPIQIYSTIEQSTLRHVSQASLAERCQTMHS